MSMRKRQNTELIEYENDRTAFVQPFAASEQRPYSSVSPRAMIVVASAICCVIITAFTILFITHAALASGISEVIAIAFAIATGVAVVVLILKLGSHGTNFICNIIDRVTMTQYNREVLNQKRDEGFWNRNSRIVGPDEEMLALPNVPFMNRYPNKRLPRTLVSEEKTTQLIDEAMIPQKFMLDEVRQIGDPDHLYFGRSAHGDVLVPLSDAYHILDIASSGKGKSNRFRLLMMQTVQYCKTYFISPFANDVKPLRKGDPRKIEVWKPIFDRLANKRPIKYGQEIGSFLQSVINEIKTREQREKDHDFSWQDKPMYVFVDEMPEVVKRCPDASDLIDQIGRIGRQYGVFVCVAAQDSLVKTIGQSTGAQANYKTRVYGGGDKTSANRVMKGSITDKDERKLIAKDSQGLALMLAEGLDDMTFVRAPLVTNEALFRHFGLEFRIEDWINNVSVMEESIVESVLSSPLPQQEKVFLGASDDTSVDCGSVTDRLPRYSGSLSKDVDTEKIHVDGSETGQVSMDVLKASEVTELLIAIRTRIAEAKAFEVKPPRVTMNSIFTEAKQNGIELNWRNKVEVKKLADRLGVEIQTKEAQSV